MKIPYDRKVFRDVLGRKMSIGLFEETSPQPDEIKPAFKLSDWHEVYIECRDPSEYKPAMRLVGDWEHWLFLRNNSTLKPIMDLWADELDACLKSEALEALNTIAKSPNGATAAKWLAEQQYREKKPVGRPKKEKEEAPMDKDEQRILNDAQRLFKRVK